MSELADAVELVREDRALEGVAQRARELFGTWWKGTGTDWGRLESLLDRAGQLRSILVQVGDADVERLAVLRERWVAVLAQGGELLGREAPLGKTLGAFRDAFEQYRRQAGDVVELLLVDEELAWGGSGEPGHLARVRRRLQEWLDHLAELRDWCLFVRACAAASNGGLGELVEALLADRVTIDGFEAVFERSFYDWWLNGVTAGSEMLKRFHGMDLNEKISRFRSLDRDLIDATRQLVRARLAAQLPIPSADAPENSEMGILLREFKKSRRHLPIRKLFQRIPNLLFRLKPCLLMSPLSVAQYLNDDMPAFDLVVFDEASQIPPWDAVGAIARGAAVIVVGDSKQLPPTTFFTTMEEEDFVAEDDFDELESILDESIAAGLPRRYLAWHYRSRHEALIAFSNYHYYDNRLLTFPAAVAKASDLGVTWRFVEDGVYERGASQTNEAEARALVAEIVTHLEDPRRAHRSIGVVTLNVHQQELVEDLLEEARRKHAAIDKNFTDQIAEPVFVKNLENVQGDERDVIMLSVGYGRDARGRISMNFGPLNRIGGERRLNVAVTRAREQLLLFSSLKASDIDLSRTASVGARHLKTFLDYAERGPTAIAEALLPPVTATGELPFEEDVENILSAKGWEVDRLVGCSGYRVDLGVLDPEDPGRYVLGIECDGANYASAETARDRDRLRQLVLRNLKWRLHRIWCMDWWLNREAEIVRLEKRLTEARLAAQQERAASSAPVAEPVAAPEEGEGEQGNGIDAWVSRAAELPGEAPYPTVKQRVVGDPEIFYEPKTLKKLVGFLENVVEQEGPVSRELAGRRLAAAWGITRMTKKVRRRLEWIETFCVEGRKIRSEEGFLWPVDQEPGGFFGFRVPREGATWLRDADDIAAVEIANAAEALLRQHVAMPREDLAREAARVFGFRRLTTGVRVRMDAGLDLLQARGGCTVENGRVSLPENNNG